MPRGGVEDWSSRRECGFAIADQLEQRSVAAMASGYQCAMRGLRLIVLQRVARKVSERAAGFVHQKIGRCKIPIVTACGCACRLQSPLGDACHPQCERMHLGLSHYSG